MDDAARPLDVLLALKDLGVRLAIDDFGTGYGSRYLERFPVDVLKIDKSFVSSLGSGRAGNAIVGSVIDLAHALDLEAVAEGVERGGQLAELRFLGWTWPTGTTSPGPFPPTRSPVS